MIPITLGFVRVPRPPANVVAETFRDTRNVGSVTATSQDASKQCSDILPMRGGRGRGEKIRVDSIVVREKIGEFKLEVPIVKHLIRRLDG